MAIEGIIGKKVGMTQLFTEDGAVLAVTVGVTRLIDNHLLGDRF